MARTDFPTAILENERFILEPSAECAIPGYLVLRLKGPATSLAELLVPEARALGEMLAAAAAAIEQAAGAERVYVLCFCEAVRRLHFHLFPRTAWLLEEYRRANGAESDAASAAVNGPLLFEWARKTFVAASRLPAGIADSETVGTIIGRMLK